MSDEFVHDLENEAVDGLAAQEVECKNYAFCESKLPRNWIEYNSRLVGLASPRSGVKGTSTRTCGHQPV